MLRPFRGRLPAVHPTAFVDETAQVIGDVTIGAESSVWMGSIVRGDVNAIRIGARTNVQDGAIIHVQSRTHPTVIGDDVTLGHAVRLHGCTIADRVLVGIGAILLNGVTIGEDSIVAAGSLVTEGTTIPPRSLVMGSPARVRRPLSDDELRMIATYAANYVRYRLDYMEPQPAGHAR